LADVRRLNVALTRSKKALWLLGNVQTLNVNLEWNQLLLDLSNRGLIIGPAYGEYFFPYQTKLLQKARKCILKDLKE